MQGKTFVICLELEIKNITCPGVWLCSNGSISMILEAFGSQYETKTHMPIFPLIFHQTFKFREQFDGVDSLESLKTALEAECFYCRLIQWSKVKNRQIGKILAEYRGTLCDLLYLPQLFENNSVDLLMAATADFPGIISPKINVVTKIQISETLERIPRNSRLNYLQCESTLRKNIKRQKTVCHSMKYHKLTECDDGRHEKDERHNLLVLSDEKHSKNHSRMECAICYEYFSMFKNEPIVSEIGDGPEYKIPSRLRLTNICQEYLRDERNLPRCVESSVLYDCDALHRKFNALKPTCLCRQS